MSDFAKPGDPSNSDMIHALSCMVSAQAEMINAMCAANRQAAAREEGPVFSRDEIRGAEAVARRFVPGAGEAAAGETASWSTSWDAGENDGGKTEEAPAGDTTVLPFPKLTAGSAADQEES